MSRTSFGRFTNRGTGPAGKRRLNLEVLEDRTTPIATPTATFSGVPSEVLLGTTGTFTVTFDNTSATSGSPTDVGYGPYIDLFLPATGADGRVSAPDDGISFLGATFLGTTVDATVLTLTAAGVAHPYAKDTSGNPLIITPPTGFFPGDQLVVLRVPFGSFTPNQPTVPITVTTTMSNLADVGTSLPLMAQGGFQFGRDPLDNPATDPTVVGASVTSSITPSLFTLTKTYIGTEDETATGPNFPRQYQISADIAPGQTITDLDLTDQLPPELQFVSVVSTSGGTVSDISTPSTTTPGGTLTRRFASVTGTANAVDAQMTFSFYVPRLDASSAQIISPTTGDDTSVLNDSFATGTWDPIDPRDPLTSVTVNGPTSDHTLTLKSIATQKTSSIVNDVGAPGLSPGDMIEYTIAFQVSDYFAFQNIMLTDIFSDGQTFVPGSAMLSVTDGHVVPSSSSGAFASANYTLTPNISLPGPPPTSGSDQLVFRVSDELVTRGFSTNGMLVGGAIPAGGGTPVDGPSVPFGATQGTITFRTTVLDSYEVDFPSGDSSINPGDPISNQVTISGDLLDVTNLTPNGNSESDDSATSNQIIGGSFTKAVYAINGVLVGTGAPEIAPGDAVTYRLRYSLPTGDVENLKFTDFLPLPIFDVDTTGAVANDFDPTASAATPAAGHAKLGPDDTFYAMSNIVPTVSTDSAANSVAFTYGTYDDLTNTSVVCDILYTVTVSADPFADRLLLTNAAQAQSNNTVEVATNSDAIAQVVLGEPALKITKGVVATNNPAGVFSPGTVGPVAFNAPGTPGARFSGTINSANLATNPINSNLSGIDQSDVVTFAIVVENTGSSPRGAFDVNIRDSFPPGYVPTGIGANGINMRVTDGAGNLLSYTTAPGGNGILDANGIVLDDPSAMQGAIGRGVVNGVPVTDGSNIVVITFDLITSNNTANQLITDVGSVNNYASQEGGPNFVPDTIHDDADVRIANPRVTKDLIRTEIDNATNANNEAVIGELVTYRVRITVPEGTTPDAVLTDTLDPQMAFVGMLSSTISPSVTLGGSLTPSVGPNGQTITWTLGDVVNSDTDNAVPEVIELEYQTVIINTSSSNAGNQVNNRASFAYTAGGPVVDSAPNVRIIEPQVGISKSVVVDGAGTIGDAGDPFTYTITLSNPPGSNDRTADAFDLTFHDLLQAGLANSPLENITFTVADTDGLVTSALFELATDPGTGQLVLQTIPGSTFDLPVNASRTITIQVTGNITQTVMPGQLVPNDAEVRWTSLDGDPGQRSPYNTNSTERTGAGGINDYINSDDADINIRNISLQKTIVTTSENATSDPSAVVVGEIVRYRIVAAIPEFGTPTPVQFVDLLPAGMEFIRTYGDDGTGLIAFVTNAGDTLTSTTLTDPSAAPPDLYLTGNQTNVATLTPEFPIPASILTAATVGGRSQLTLDLGLVTNPANASNDSEFVIAEFNVLVTNVVGNQAGTTLVNQVTAVQNGTTAGQPASSPTLRVAEPAISNLSKSVVSLTDPQVPDSQPHDAGDRVRYRVDYSNGTGANVSTAYNVQLLDTPPAGKMNLDPTSVLVFRNGVQISSGFTNNSTATSINVTLDTVAPGDTIRVVYEAVLTTAVQAGETIQNTANVTWTSLPGDQGTPGNPTGSTTPGNSGAASGERNGADGAGGALNDYSDSDTATISIVVPLIDKSILDTSFPQTTSSQFDPNLVDLAIGESVTYRIIITLPEGTTNVNLTDMLPTNNAGTVVYNSAQVVAIGGNISGSALAVGSPGVVSGSTVTFNFGTVVNTPDNIANGLDQIVVDVVGTVTDLAENQSGVQVTNTATLDYGQGTVSDNATADIVAPHLDIQKSASPTQADAGDVITYTAVVSHLSDSTAAAFQVVITDPLNSGNLVLIPGSVTTSGVPGATVVVGNNPGDTTITVTLPVLLLGQSLTISYQATVTGAPTPGTAVQNTATLNSNTAPSGDNGRPSTDNDPADVTVYSNTISGVVYHDTNDNGVYEPGAGDTLITTPVTMQLTGTDHLGNPVSINVLTAGGTYSFTGLRPSDANGYTVTEVDQPAAFVDGRDTPGTPFGGTGTLGATPRDADAITTIAIPRGSNPAGVNYNFGELTPGTIGDFVWNDLNGNGIQDSGEPGVDGLTVTLTGTNPDNTPFTFTTTTASGGLYSFTGLRPGSYTVQFTTPTDYVFTIPNVGGDDTVDSDASRNLGQAPVTLSLGETNNSVDAGVYLGASLSGFVYRDFSIDGIRQPAGVNPETGIAGVRIILTGVDPLNNSLPTRTTTTDATGAYQFDLLPQGTYTVTEIQPPSVFTASLNGFYDGLDTVGTIGGTQQGSSPAKNVLQVDLDIGNSGVEYNFGENPPADPFGFVYIDLNDNAIREPGEPGIPGVAVTVSGTAFPGTPLERPLTAADIPGGQLTVYTNSDGRWEFQIIPPGTYSLVETQPPGFIDGREEDADPHGPPATVGNDRFDDVQLNPFPVRGPFNFGELAANSSLAGSVYIDTNNNGIRDQGELGIPGTTVTLTGTDLAGRSVVATVVTDVNGNYLIRNMFGGTYTLTETQPANFLDGRDRAGTLGGVAGNDIITSIPVGLQQAGTLYQFGERGIIDPSKYWLLTNSNMSQLFGTPGSGVTDVNFVPGTTPPPTTPIATIPPSRLVTRTPAGTIAQLFDFNAGSPKLTINPFPGFQGALNFAQGDVTGDGVADLLVATAVGASHVKVFDGATGTQVRSFLSFPGFNGGVNLSSGDVDGDGYADIVVSTATGSSHVKAFSGRTGQVLSSFLAFPGYSDGVQISAGDENGDGRADIAVAPVFGSSHVKVFDALTNTPFRSFMAYEGFTGNITIAFEPTTGAPARLFVGTATQAAHIKAFSGGVLLQSFYAYPGYTGGVRLAVGDVDGDGSNELLTLAAGTDHVKVFSNTTEIDSFLAEPNPSVDLAESLLWFGRHRRLG